MKHFIDEKTKKLIGFNYLIRQLNINTPYGKKHLKGLKEYDNYLSLNEEFRLIELFSHLMKSPFPIEKTITILQKFKDIEKTLDNCLNHQILDLVDLYEIKIQAILMQQLKKELNQAIDNKLQIIDCLNIVHILSQDEKSITPDFYLYNSYSDKLKDIRIKKREIEQQFFKVKDNNQLVNLKQKRSEFVILEEEEELKVRKQLSSNLQSNIKVMQDNIKKIGHIDVLLAKAQLALKYNGIKPHISDTILNLTDMISPSIKLQVENDGNNYIKNTIRLKRGTTVLTGANMSGKSSVLKTVALNILLSHLGFFVFAKEATIPFFHSIKYLANELDSNLHGLSSFGQEVTKLNEVIQNMKQEKSLVLLDEFARSTNPSEGQKFVQAFAEYAHTFDSFTLMATHYDGVVKKTMKHYQIAGLKEDANIHTVGDIHKMMDYSLKKVSLKEQVPKEAYKVSLLLNIDEDYKEYLDKNYGSDVN